MPVYDKTGSYRVIGDLAASITVKQTGSLVSTYAEFINFTGGAVQSVTISGLGVDVSLASGSGGTSSPQFSESATSPRIRTTASLVIGSGSLFAENYRANINFYVSGTIVTGSTNANSMSVFGGSVIMSGNLYIQSLASSQSFIQLKVENGDPDTADVNSLRINAEMFASRAVLEIKGPYDKTGYALQPALFGPNIIYAGPNTTTTLLTWGANFTTSGTISTPVILAVPVSGILGTARSFRCTPIANVGLGSGARTTDPVCWRGNYSGSGGFFHHQRFGSSFQTPSRCFVGLNSTNAFLGHVLDVSGSTNVDFIGIGYDRNDPLTGSWRIMRCGIANAQYLSVEIPGMLRHSTTGSLIDFYIYAAPFSTGVFVEVVEHISQTLGTSGVNSIVRFEQFFTTSIPNPATFLRMQAGIFTQTGTLPSTLQISRMYLETNF